MPFAKTDLEAREEQNSSQNVARNLSGEEPDLTGEPLIFTGKANFDLEQVKLDTSSESACINACARPHVLDT